MTPVSGSWDGRSGSGSHHLDLLLLLDLPPVRLPLPSPPAVAAYDKQQTHMLQTGARPARVSTEHRGKEYT